MHMIDVMKKLQEIAEAGYDNEDIQRGIDAAGKHVVKKNVEPIIEAERQDQELSEKTIGGRVTRPDIIDTDYFDFDEYPDDPIPTPPTPPIDDDEYPDDLPPTPEYEINPGLYPDPEIGSEEWYKQNQLPPDVMQSQVMVKGKDGKMYGTPHAASLADRVYDYNVKQGKIKPEINIDGASTFGKMKIQKEDDMAWLRKAAGIGSGAKSNHGIHEGEEGYQITPRSLVAREMRKLQDIAKD